MSYVPEQEAQHSLYDEQKTEAAETPQQAFERMVKNGSYPNSIKPHIEAIRTALAQQAVAIPLNEFVAKIYNGTTCANGEACKEIAQYIKGLGPIQVVE